MNYPEFDKSTPVLDELGLLGGEQVRFRRREEDHWSSGVVKGDSKDGSLSIVDKDGKWRAIMPDKVQVASKGVRGGRVWKSLKP